MLAWDRLWYFTLLLPSEVKALTLFKSLSMLLAASSKPLHANSPSDFPHGRDLFFFAVAHLKLFDFLNGLLYWLPFRVLDFRFISSRSSNKDSYDCSEGAEAD